MVDRVLMTSTLYKNSKAITILIDRAPQIGPFFLNSHNDFVDMPGIP
jgi:hypothetical protein